MGTKIEYGNKGYHIAYWILILILGAFIQNGLDQHKADRVLLKEVSVQSAYRESSLILAMNNFQGEVEPEYPNPVFSDDYIGISSPLGIRTNPLKPDMGGQNFSYHMGVDLTGTFRARIISVCDGTVLEKWYVPDASKGRKGNPLFGGYLRIIDKNGRIFGYGHLSAIYVHEGNHVTQGQVIGRMGNTGQSTGQHLHFSIEDNNEFINPLKHIALR